MWKSTSVSGRTWNRSPGLKFRRPAIATPSQRSSRWWRRWRRRSTRIQDEPAVNLISARSGGKLVAGKLAFGRPVKCAADAKLGALARGMAQPVATIVHGAPSMSTHCHAIELVGALEAEGRFDDADCRTQAASLLGREACPRPGHSRTPPPGGRGGRLSIIKSFPGHSRRAAGAGS